MIFRMILPEWVKTENPALPPVREGHHSDEEVTTFNAQGYNIYFWPNPPDDDAQLPINGSQIHKFQYVFVDMDLKDGKHASKEAFLALLMEFACPPTFVVDSGNGCHAYWQCSDLDALGYLKLQRRLYRQFNTDPAVSKVCQIMRLPNTVNTKIKGEAKPCKTLHESDFVYTCEQLSQVLPSLTAEDAAYCQTHYSRTYNLGNTTLKIADSLPPKFGKLLSENTEVKDTWLGNTYDRSKSDYRLGHIMCAAGFTKAEAMSVLVNSAKALTRAPEHRVSYAENIVSKIWTFEETKDKNSLDLSNTVREILERHDDDDSLKGIRFPCHKYVDDTKHGFRLGNVIGLVGGSGVGKSAIALNFFEGFVQNNPDYDHFFIPLEQPVEEIADRWRLICGDRQHLHDKVHLISNYDAEGKYRNLGLSDIKDYLVKFQAMTNKKIGCVVIDHIGALSKKSKVGENQSLMDICQEMKAFAIQTNTVLIMQSQAPREKAGIGDLEISKDAAYGTVYFESFCDYLITIWQPVKRCYAAGAPTVAAYKFCKIRHKHQLLDTIKEDVCYKMFFESETGRLRRLTETEDKSFKFFLNQAASKRKEDRKTEVGEYVSVNREPSNNSDTGRVTELKRLSVG